MPNSVPALGRLAIVCPMANEEKTACAFATATLAAAADFDDARFFVVLDRASKDRTRDLLLRMAREESRLRVIWAPENRNVVDAYLAGYREALASGFEWILEIDGGFSHDPVDFHRFVEKARAGYEAVFGSRFCEGGRMTETSLKRRFISRWGSHLANMLLGTKLSDMTSGYQLFRRDAIVHVMERGIRSRAHFFQTEMKTHCRGLRIAEVPIHYSNASESVGRAEIIDACVNLGRLTRDRVMGRL